MQSKYFEKIKVDTYLQTVRCPNGDCTGTLKADGKQRSSDGLQGGVPEFRHKCDTCDAGCWLLKQYPVVEYVLVPKAEIKQTLNLPDKTEKV